MTQKIQQRWTENEVDLFLQTIINELNGDPTKFEKPTGQIFYEKIRTNIPELQRFSHTAMKNKFNYLKAQYMKAINWRSSTGAGSNLEEGETIEDRLIFMCNKFYQLDEILSSKRSVNLPPIADTLEDPLGEQVSYSNLEYLNDQQIFDVQNPHQIDSHESTTNESDDLQPKNKKSRTSSSNVSGPVNALLQIQERRMESELLKSEKQAEIERDKLVLERERFDAAKQKEQVLLNLEQRKLDLEERKLNEECVFRRFELENQHEIAKAKIESEERIRKYELELKYKNHDM